MSATLPRFSIITPSLNQARFIRQTIESVLSQDYPDIEYIVMDGGSTDSTPDILREYGHRLQWVSETDKGQADAINKGIQRATGKLIGFINSDDYLLPGALRFAAERLLEKPEHKWLTGDYVIIDQQGQPIQPFTVLYKRLYRKLSSPAVLAFTNYIVQPSTFWKREVHDEIGYLDNTLRYTFDYDFWMRLMRLCQPYCVEIPLSAFRIHPNSKGGSEYGLQFREELGVLQRYNKNQALIHFHKLHNQLIIAAYKILK
jgi:glycosyltransferase involved in cell wall biosynthesis